MFRFGIRIIANSRLLTVRQNKNPWKSSWRRRRRKELPSRNIDSTFFIWFDGRLLFLCFCQSEIDKIFFPKARKKKSWTKSSGKKENSWTCRPAFQIVNDSNWSITFRWISSTRTFQMTSLVRKMKKKHFFFSENFCKSKRTREQKTLSLPGDNDRSIKHHQDEVISRLIMNDFRCSMIKPILNLPCRRWR